MARHQACLFSPSNLNIIYEKELARPPGLTRTQFFLYVFKKLTYL
jgi:hypothetical protein